MNTVEANNKGVVRETFDAAVAMAGDALDLEGLTAKAKDVFDDNLHDAERFMMHGKEMVYDTVDDTTYFIKRHPWQSVGYALGGGIGLGLLTGWLIGRRGNNTF